MNNLVADIGYKSINHYGEQLCGDHIVIKDTINHGTVLVLADGLGSGVKASILSTLTSTIISTMMAAGLSLENCVSTIVATLPVCAEREVAYSTFTIIHLLDGNMAEIIQYDNPTLIFLRNGHNYNYKKTEIELEGKKILYSLVKLHEGDTMITMSDGCPYAGSAETLNFNWSLSEITTFMETYSMLGFTAKALASMLVDECNRLYKGKPGDDTTSLVVRMKKRNAVNVLFGPPKDPSDCPRLMEDFFSAEGQHVVSGGTTAAIVGEHLRKPVVPLNNPQGADVPPMSQIEGVDLVTEGVVTMERVLEYARDYVGDGALTSTWTVKRDAAAILSRLLFEEATHITIFAGQAVNPVYKEEGGAVIGQFIKARIVQELKECLEKMGKTVTVIKY